MKFYVYFIDEGDEEYFLNRKEKTQVFASQVMGFHLNLQVGRTI